MPSKPHDEQYWLDRAKEVRRQADRLNTPNAKRLMLEIAAVYQRLGGAYGRQGTTLIASAVARCFAEPIPQQRPAPEAGGQPKPVHAKYASCPRRQVRVLPTRRSQLELRSPF